MSDAATAGTRSVRSGHAGAHRKPAGAGAARLSPAPPALRRRRRRSFRHDRRDQAARAEAGSGVRRPAGRACDSGRLRDRGARPVLAGRAQQPRRFPRVLVNETYAATIRRGATREEDKQYISAQLQSANWLTKSLEQRARTILNVASEIVRRQDAFLVEGVSKLRPLNLKMVGEAIGVHEFDRLARHCAQVHSDPARPVRNEVFFHRRHRFGQLGRGPLGRIRSPAHPPDDRRGRAARRPFRRRHRRATAQGRHRRRAAHRRQVPRQPEDSLVGRATKNEIVAPSTFAGARSLRACGV